VWRCRKEVKKKNFPHTKDIHCVDVIIPQGEPGKKKGGVKKQRRALRNKKLIGELS